MANSIRNWEADQRAEQQTGQNQPKPDIKYISAFRALSAFAKPHKWSFTLIFFCTLLAIAADLLQPYLVKVIIDDHLMAGNGEFRAIIGIGVLYLGLAAMSLLFTYLQNNMLQYTGQSIVAKVRKQLFEHISKLSMSYFDRTSSGSLITHVSSDTESLNQLFSQVLMSVLRDGMTLVFIIFLMFQLDAQLALYCLLLLPIIAGIAIGFRSYMRRTYQRARTQLSRLIAFTAENLAGMNLIQVFHQEKEQQREFTERNEGYFRANMKEVKTQVWFRCSFDILSNLSIAFVTWLGGMAVLNKQIEFGVLYAFITYIRQFFQPLNTITQQWNTLQSATVAVTRIWGIFALKPEVENKEKPRALAKAQVRGDIEFDHVVFGYGDRTPVIQDLSLHIRSGERIGIVGTTGAGKSSLISLLCRFYDVRSGGVRIDGTDVRDIEQAQLHRIVGLVQQEPYLYSGSVLDNVRLFDMDIDEETVMEACRLVGADAIIKRMSDGYNTRLSERGSGLSAGERQLISFARIIVFQPKILILDEATANLDSYSEQLLEQALAIVSRGRTTIIIAHRLSTVMKADRIIVMRKGEIAEQGTHSELVRRHGYYEELYRHSRGKVFA